ncbi:MAG TPA: efflux transporter outer membrane subunit [Sphingobium sp.]|nr:efflux transporter outer membrane subunit [Sphingobium sp.]
MTRDRDSRPLRRLSGGVGLGLGLLLSGCAVGPNFHAPPAPTARHYLPDSAPGDGDVRTDGAMPALAPNAPIPARWWTIFGNAALDQLVETALVANSDIAIADAALRRVQAEARIARGALLPQIDASYDAARIRESETFSDPLVAPDIYLYSLHTASLAVTYPLDLFGGLRRGAESARAQARAETFRAQAARQTVIANTVLAAIEEAALRARIAETRDSIVAARESLALIQRQQQLGAVGAGDVAAQETALGQLETTLPALMKAQAAQRNALSVLLGRESWQALPAEIQLDQLVLPERLPVTLPSDLVRQRPDIRAAEATLHAASADVGVAIAARLPALSISAQAGGQSTRFADMFRDGNPFWNVIGNLTQPLLQGGRLLRQQRAAEAALDEAKAQYRAAVLGAFEDVANALTALDTDGTALAAADRADTAAGRSYAFLQRRQILGEVGTLELLQAAAARGETANALIEARAARFAAVAGLYHALGGGAIGSE